MLRHSPKVPRRQTEESILIGCLLIVVFSFTIAAMFAYSI